MLITKLFILILLAVIWTLIFACIVTVGSVFHILGWVLLLPVWIGILLFSVVLYIPPVRRIFISRPFLRKAKKTMPPISETERAALEAGGVWWEAELFSGRPQWKNLFAIKKPSLTSEEKHFLENQVPTLCKMLNDWKIVHEDVDLPEEVWEYIKKERFFGMAIKKEYGGLGFSSYAQSNVVSMVATRSISAAVNIMVPNSLGPGELLVHYGTDAQRKYYLPRLANGIDVPCFGLTSPHAGSDAAKIQDTAIICKGQYQGKEVLGMRVSWDKRYITLAPIATLLGLAVKLYDPEHLLGLKEDLGITLILVPMDQPGVEHGERHFPCYTAFQNGPVRGNDVFMPLEWIIGGEKMAGQGWRMLMECLSFGRGISLPALTIGASKLVYRMTGAYARLREQFGLPIGKFEGVADAMGEIAGSLYMMEATRTMTALGIDLGINPSLVTAITKYHMTETGRKIANHAMDIHAGRGIQAGPRNYLLNSFMGIPVAITVEGANILTRSLIIFGQGALRCHPYVFDEMQAVNDPNPKESLKKFDQLLVKHISYSLSNVIRSFLFGVGFGRFMRSPMQGEFKPYFQRLTRLSTALSLASDISMATLGGNLKRMESLSARLGDVLSHLYIASAALKYYVDNGEQEADRPHLHWVLQHCIYESQEALVEFFANFPSRVFAKVMKFLVFPFGRRFHAPSDRLTHELAEIMMGKPSEFRDRVTQYCYVGDTMDDPTGRMEITYNRLFELSSLLNKVKHAEKEGKLPRHVPYENKLALALRANILTQHEAEQLLQFDAMRMDAMHVDEFAPEYLGGQRKPHLKIVK